MALAQSASSMAGASLKSRVGSSSPISWTRRAESATAQSWFTAAPPSMKFATIWRVTSAG